MSAPEQYLMVLNDGTTYTDLTRCKIVAVPADTDPEDIEAVLNRPTPDNCRVIATFGVDEWTGPVVTKAYGRTVRL